jgi:hypothetical protein
MMRSDMPTLDGRFCRHHKCSRLTNPGGGESDRSLNFPPRGSTRICTLFRYLPNQVTHLNDALLAQLDLPKMESFWFTAKDGTKLEGFMIRPPGFDAAKKYPVKFLIHGGPQGAWGDDWSYRWNAELFAANGYVVIMINHARVDGVWAGDCGRRERRLGRQAVYRPDGGARLRGAALSVHR